MGFYRKQLKGVDDLKREKKLLLKEKEELGKEPFFSLDGILGKGKKDANAPEATNAEGGGFEIADILSLLPVLSPALTGVSSIASKVFGKDKGEQKEKNIIAKVVKEVAWGYLKWKAIELSIKGVRHMMKKKKENREG